jgi:hypothetical protein
MNIHTKQFLQGCKLLSKLPATAWKPVTGWQIYVVLGLYILTGIIQKPKLRSNFTTKRVLSATGFSNIITKDKLELIC